MEGLRIMTGMTAGRLPDSVSFVLLCLYVVVLAVLLPVVFYSLLYC